MSSFLLYGIGVSSGIAIGRAQLVSHAALEVAHYTIKPGKIASEIARLTEAMQTVEAELLALRLLTEESEAQAEFSTFIDIHAMILRDPAIALEPKRIIEEQLCNAEWALSQQMHHLVGEFDEIDDEYLRERRYDVVQVVERVLKVLLGKPSGLKPKQQAEDRTILVAHDLSPADVLQYKDHRFKAFITDVGGVTAHTAIVARSLGIPAVVATHHGRDLIQEDELLIVDGDNHLVIVNPDKSVLAEYRLRQSELELARQKLKRLRTTPATTIDGVTIELHANIELPADVAPALENGATGIGLFRSEFLFLNRQGLPTEEEQFIAYKDVIEGMAGAPVTIRTFDLGADKQLEGVTFVDRVETNPALGLRAIRLCLAEPRLFQTQLRAILRASAFGAVKILIPMLAALSEIDSALAAIASAKQSLREAGVAFDEHVQVGGMVEIPAAVLAIGMFTARLDFLSIGTNDLIQYTLAVDRADESVSYLYDPLHPAVLRLIQQTIRAANKTGVPISVCGEMAGDLRFTRLLLGMGLRNFSMHPSQILSIKQRILKSNTEELREYAAKIIKADEPEKINALIEKMNALNL